MKWLDRLERKYGRWGIPNLTAYLMAGQILTYAFMEFIDPALYGLLALYRGGVLAGQLWRLVSFMFLPFSGGSILGFAISCYFFWFIGTQLEQHWGSFRYTVYILAGMLGAILAAMATGYADNYCLSFTLFWAFAALYPNMQVLLFFVLPIRVKHLGMISGALWLLSFLAMGWAGKLRYLLCILNFLLFFGPGLWRSVRAWQRRARWQRQNRR